MIKKSLLLLAAAMCLVLVPVSCEEAGPETPQEENQDQNQDQKPDEVPEEKPEKEEPIKLSKLTGEVPVVGDMIFSKRPELTVQITNPNAVDVKVLLTMAVTTDKGVPAVTWSDSVLVAASCVDDIEWTTNEDLAPGFYTVSCSINKKIARTRNFGVDPFDIVSAPDMQDDFDEFWAAAKAQLPELIEGETFTLTKVSSDNYRTRYLVEMQSVPNGPDGEPVIVRGYYAEPNDGKKHPVLMRFYGWDDGNSSGTGAYSQGPSEYAEFCLSTRGQYLNRATSIGDGIKDNTDYASRNWFAFNFGDKDSFYYRGAFMDCVQAVRFMASRSTSDMNNLFAEGSSQGGALSYACAALSDYPFTAIAPNVAFLGDYPDYFDIVSWPGNVAKSNQGSMTDEQMYAFLSYFDTKNLATRISAAVMASSGLNDTTCPPHTNFAPFNNLNTEDKVMIVGPTMTHDYPKTWNTDWQKFFKERMK